MTDALTFSVYGTPRPKARPRFVGGRVVTTVKPKEKLWIAALDRAAKEAIKLRGDPVPLFTGPVRVRMVFTFAEPSRADADNLAKAPMDRMTRARVYADDRQVFALDVQKKVGKPVGLVVLVEPIASEPPAATSTASEAPGWLR